MASKVKEQKKFSIYINISSGTAQSLGEEALRAKIKQSSLANSHLYLLEAETFFKIIKDISKKDTPILIGGGDGTIKSAAEILMEKDIAFAKNLENNSAISLTNITLLQINFSFKKFYCTLLLIRK